MLLNLPTLPRFDVLAKAARADINCVLSALEIAARFRSILNHRVHVLIWYKLARQSSLKGTPLSLKYRICTYRKPLGPKLPLRVQVPNNHRFNPKTVLRYFY